MRRVHLFEFGDQPWYPEVLRRAGTAYLATVYRLSRELPRCWAEKVATVLRQNDRVEILDLCSGSKRVAFRVVCRTSLGSLFNRDFLVCSLRRRWRSSASWRSVPTDGVGLPTVANPAILPSGQWAIGGLAESDTPLQ